MFILVAYDIAEPSRLRKIAKIMEDYGDRVQYSVFEMDIDFKIFQTMKRRTEAVLHKDEDGVKYFFLCKRCAGQVEAMGLEGERQVRNLRPVSEFYCYFSTPF